MGAYCSATRIRWFPGEYGKSQWAKLGQPINVNGRTEKVTPELLVRDVSYKKVMGDARSWIKDELLAYMSQLNAFEENKMNSGKKRDVPFTKLIDESAQLLRQGDIYDYFLHYYGFDPKSELYKTAWAEHRAVVAEAIQTINTITSTYQRFALHERFRLFRWVLAGIPMNDWGEAMKHTFTREAELLTKAADDDPFFTINGPGTTPLRYSRKAIEFYKQMTVDGAQATTPIGQCFMNQGRPFFRYLQQLS